MPKARAPVEPRCVGAVQAGGGIPAFWGLEWELNEKGWGKSPWWGMRGSDLVTRRISDGTGSRIRSLLGYVVVFKLIFLQCLEAD